MGKKNEGKGAKKAAKLKPGELEIDPREIRFTHSRIRPFFSCGRRVLDTLEDVRAGTLSTADMPIITVIQVGLSPHI